MQERLQKFSSQYSPSLVYSSSTVYKSSVFTIKTSRTHRNLRKKDQSIYVSTIKDSSNPKMKQKQFNGHRSSLRPDRRTLYWQTSMLPNFPMSTKYFSISIPPTVKSYSYCAMMSDTNQIIAQKNASVKLQIASLTKIMTAYTVIQLSHIFGLKLREIYIEIHNESANMQGTSACLHQGQQVLAFDLLYGLLLPSGNDAAIAFAQYFGKMISFKYASDEQLNDSIKVDKFQQVKEFYDTEYGKDSIKLFVFEMNKNAHNLGLTSTHFANPTALNNINNYSTSKDMGKLISHCLKNHILKSIFKTKMHICDVKNKKLTTSRQVQWKNTNKLLFEKKQCIGVKTGITSNAGPCLSTAFRLFKKQLIIIVLKSQGLDDRYTDTLSIYRYCRKKVKII